MAAVQTICRSWKRRWCKLRNPTLTAPKTNQSALPSTAITPKMPTFPSFVIIRSRFRDTISKVLAQKHREKMALSYLWAEYVMDKWSGYGLVLPLVREANSIAQEILFSLTLRARANLNALGYFLGTITDQAILLTVCEWGISSTKGLEIYLDIPRIWINDHEDRAISWLVIHTESYRLS